MDAALAPSSKGRMLHKGKVDGAGSESEQGQGSYTTAADLFPWYPYRKSRAGDSD